MSTAFDHFAGLPERLQPYGGLIRHLATTDVPTAPAIRSGVERGDPFAVVRDRPVGSGVDAGQRIRAANWPTLPAVTDEPVTDDPHSPAPQVEIITADADGQDADSMEHDRQRRLARWHRQPE